MCLIGEPCWAEPLVIFLALRFAAPLVVIAACVVDMMAVRLNQFDHEGTNQSKKVIYIREHECTVPRCGDEKR